MLRQFSAFFSEFALRKKKRSKYCWTNSVSKVVWKMFQLVSVVSVLHLFEWVCYTLHKCNGWCRSPWCWTEPGKHSISTPFLGNISASVHYGPTVNKPKAVYYPTDSTPHMSGVWCSCYLAIHVHSCSVCSIYNQSSTVETSQTSLFKMLIAIILYCSKWVGFTETLFPVCFVLSQYPGNASVWL